MVCGSLWFLLSSPPTASLQVVDPSPSPRGNDEGLCFADGKRKVDYVLVFHQRRHSSIRCPTSTSASHDRLSIVSNGNFPPSVGPDADQGRGGIPGMDAPSVGEVFVELGGSEAAEPADHEIHLIRQEFEASLVEAGLEVERESEVSEHTACQSPAMICMLRYTVQSWCGGSPSGICRVCMMGWMNE